MNSAAFFAERRGRADFDAFDRLMQRQGGEPPQPEDLVPGPVYQASPALMPKFSRPGQRTAASTPKVSASQPPLTRASRGRSGWSTVLGDSAGMPSKLITGSASNGTAGSSAKPISIGSRAQARRYRDDVLKDFAGGWLRGG